MKGKHEKRKPQKLKKHIFNAPKLKIMSVVIMVIGIIMVVTALIVEAEQVPWGKLFGTANQSEDSIPDPKPIVLDNKDSDIHIVTKNDDVPIPAPSFDMTVLPGDIDDDTSGDDTFEVIGILKIPVLGVSQNLIEGSGRQMKYGVGHVKGTAAPGQKGNCAVSGHRPYPFRYLDTLVKDDNVIIKTGDITCTYKVYDSFEVLPDETWVLNDIWGEQYSLTLITCTPYMVSSHRLIIRARLNDIDGMSPAEYYGEPEPTNTPANEDGSKNADSSTPSPSSPASPPAETPTIETQESPQASEPAASEPSGSDITNDTQSQNDAGAVELP